MTRLALLLKSVAIVFLSVCLGIAWMHHYSPDGSAAVFVALGAAAVGSLLGRDQSPPTRPA